MHDKKTYTDFLVVGSGVAGLSYALKVADHGKVIILSKSNISETNTRYAQGGIAAVTSSQDTYEKHVNDTLIAGDGLCDRKVVEMVISEAPEQIEELIHWGTNFDKNSEGNFDLAKEGGHSENRILHHKDNTGAEIQRALTKAVQNHPNITILEHHFGVDLITQHHLKKMVRRNQDNIECYGIYALDLKSKQIITILSKITLLATGGIGNIYHVTTNPTIATGSGIAMTYRAKGHVKNMEFVQFHPTSLFNPGQRPSFLITEAMRGHGGILRNEEGEDFMLRYDERGSLAPRDIVARAIDSEMKASGSEHVYLDCTHLDGHDLKEHFPTINKHCTKIGIDIAKDLIPVVPAAHYLCGGIEVDVDGQSTIENLYAAGEVSCTGLHGANRLASNSLLEAIVYSHRAAIDGQEGISEIKHMNEIPDWDDLGTTLPEEMVLITQNYKEVQQIFSYYVGIVRSDVRLKRALDRLEIIYRETEKLFKKSKLTRELCELRDMINVGYLIIKMAQERKESIGLHYNIDYPPK